jgi:hypothetical protein
MSEIGKTGAGHKADIARAAHCNTHVNFPSRPSNVSYEIRSVAEILSLTLFCRRQESQEGRLPTCAADSEARKSKMVGRTACETRRNADAMGGVSKDYRIRSRSCATTAPCVGGLTRVRPGHPLASRLVIASPALLRTGTIAEFLKGYPRGSTLVAASDSSYAPWRDPCARLLAGCREGRG